MNNKCKNLNEWVENVVRADDSRQVYCVIQLSNENPTLVCDKSFSLNICSTV